MMDTLPHELERSTSHIFATPIAVTPDNGSGAESGSETGEVGVEERKTSLSNKNASDVAPQLVDDRADRPDTIDRTTSGASTRVVTFGLDIKETTATTTGQPQQRQGSSRAGSSQGPSSGGLRGSGDSLRLEDDHPDSGLQGSGDSLRLEDDDPKSVLLRKRLRHIKPLLHGSSVGADFLRWFWLFQGAFAWFEAFYWSWGATGGKNPRDHLLYHLPAMMFHLFCFLYSLFFVLWHGTGCGQVTWDLCCCWCFACRRGDKSSVVHAPVSTASPPSSSEETGENANHDHRSRTGFQQEHLHQQDNENTSTTTCCCIRRCVCSLECWCWRPAFWIEQLLSKVDPDHALEQHKSQRPKNRGAADFVDYFLPFSLVLMNLFQFRPFSVLLIWMDFLLLYWTFHNAYSENQYRREHPRMQLLGANHRSLFLQRTTSVDVTLWLAMAPVFTSTVYALKAGTGSLHGILHSSHVFVVLCFSVTILVYLLEAYLSSLAAKWHLKIAQRSSNRQIARAEQLQPTTVIVEQGRTTTRSTSSSRRHKNRVSEEDEDVGDGGIEGASSKLQQAGKSSPSALASSKLQEAGKSSPLSNGTTRGSSTWLSRWIAEKDAFLPWTQLQVLPGREDSSDQMTENCSTGEASATTAPSQSTSQERYSCPRSVLRCCRRTCCGGSRSNSEGANANKESQGQGEEVNSANPNKESQEGDEVNVMAIDIYGYLVSLLLATIVTSLMAVIFLLGNVFFVTRLPTANLSWFGLKIEFLVVFFLVTCICSNRLLVVAFELSWPSTGTSSLPPSSTSTSPAQENVSSVQQKTFSATNAVRLEQLRFEQALYAVATNWQRWKTVGLVFAAFVAYIIVEDELGRSVNNIFEEEAGASLWSDAAILLMLWIAIVSFFTAEISAWIRQLLAARKCFVETRSGTSTTTKNSTSTSKIPFAFVLLKHHLIALFIAQYLIWTVGFLWNLPMLSIQSGLVFVPAVLVIPLVRFPTFSLRLILAGVLLLTDERVVKQRLAARGKEPDGEDTATTATPKLWATDLYFVTTPPSEETGPSDRTPGANKALISPSKEEQEDRRLVIYLEECIILRQQVFFILAILFWIPVWLGYGKAEICHLGVNCDSLAPYGFVTRADISPDSNVMVRDGVATPLRIPEDVSLSDPHFARLPTAMQRIFTTPFNLTFLTWNIQRGHPGTDHWTRQNFAEVYEKLSLYRAVDKDQNSDAKYFFPVLPDVVGLQEAEAQHPGLGARDFGIFMAQEVDRSHGSQVSTLSSTNSTGARSFREHEVGMCSSRFGTWSRYVQLPKEGSQVKCKWFYGNRVRSNSFGGQPIIVAPGLDVDEMTMHDWPSNFPFPTFGYATVQISLVGKIIQVYNCHGNIFEREKYWPTLRDEIRAKMATNEINAAVVMGDLNWYSYELEQVFTTDFPGMVHVLNPTRYTIPEDNLSNPHPGGEEGYRDMFPSTRIVSGASGSSKLDIDHMRVVHAEALDGFWDLDISDHIPMIATIYGLS
ncbi:unnamed protein product [Amoebophrya sp. A25]|nr:unnamed protein product [Amoebophrya sp. A25]|eukprot:GSA25T00008627001.1